MNKLPLLCANPQCGTVLLWVEAATNQPRQCPNCHRYTAFTIVDGKVDKRLLKVKPPDRTDMDHLMRESRGVDPRRC